ncbi:MAG: DUF4827 domain-containing protein [Muribaculaceae bacterium]|nr:DUF4827 domain-containing protein [Muribaculaceae bacterium]
MNIKLKYHLVAALLISLFATSCSKTESYSDLLKKEQKASNWFLAQHRVCNEIPADSVFQIGPDAPYYRMDDDGYVYMQVLRAADPKDRNIPKTGDQVYFTFTRWNIDAMYSSNSLNISSEIGNQDNFAETVAESYFIFNNYNVNSSSQYGSGMQIPVSYLGYNSEVNILLKSYYGFASENTTCVPYKVNVRYFKAEY